MASNPSDTTNVSDTVHGGQTWAHYKQDQLVQMQSAVTQASGRYQGRRLTCRLGG